MKDIQIFLVDDHQVVREGLRRMLEQEKDMEVVGQGGDSQEVLSQLEAHCPDIVLMDIKMPGMDGIELTQRIKQKHPSCRVIILTLYDEYLMQAVEAGAAGYLLKDIKHEELTRAIRRVHSGETAFKGDIIPPQPPVEYGQDRGQAPEIDSEILLKEVQLVIPSPIDDARLTKLARRLEEILECRVLVMTGPRQDTAVLAASLTTAMSLADILSKLEEVPDIATIEERPLGEAASSGLLKKEITYLNAIKSLAHALEARDRYTGGHSQRVADVSVAIARRLGLPQESIDKIRLAGLLHDVGKIGVMESILNKPSHLTQDEFQRIKKHPEIGEHILAPIAEDEEILKVVRSHHERYDGTGYPDKLKGRRIPLGARILAVSDAYEAMTSERPYRKAMSDEIACNEIEQGKGSQFDPEVADAFLNELVGSYVSKSGNKSSKAIFVTLADRKENRRETFLNLLGRR